MLPQIIIIVDDGSSDDQKISNSFIDNILNGKINFKLITHKKNMGAVSSIKTGLSYIKTKYFKISASQQFTSREFTLKM